MSEGLAEVRLLSSGYMSTECRWPCGAHVSEISEAHFQIGAVFINKLQIWVLNNYILTWNTCFQCRQALSVAARHVWFRHGVTHLPRKKQSNLGVQSQAFRSLSSPQHWKADTIRYLHVSYFLPYRSADVFLFCFLSAISIFLSLVFDIKTV